MVNPSIASQLISEEDDEVGLWVIVDDFIGFKPNPNFWVNLRRISGTFGGHLIQYSVYQAGTRLEAEAMRSLVRHYGGEAQTFECKDPTYS
jgi:hypothetical protein